MPLNYVELVYNMNPVDVDTKKKVHSNIFSWPSLAQETCVARNPIKMLV